MSQLRPKERELAERGVAVLIVTFEPEWRAKLYVQETSLPWPLLMDHDRSLYRAYGMQSGRWWDLAGPAAIWVYLKLMARGRRLRRPGSDVRQLGGNVVIGPDGVVAFHHRGDGPADRPTPETVLAAIPPAGS